MAISSPGLGSGLDVSSIVSQLVALERKPLEKMQTAATFMQTQVSAYGQLQSLVSAVGDAAKALAKPTLWQAASAGTSDATSVAATASAGAAIGSYSVSVSQIARAQSLASAVFTAPTDVVGAGKMTIELGGYNVANDPAFTPKTGSTTLELEFAEGTTLEEVKTQINAANAGVSAAIVRDANGARLTLTSTTTGLDSTLRVAVSDATGALTGLAYDPASGANPMTQTQAAVNALASINGLAIESPTNRLTGTLDGVTLDLVKVTTAPVTVNVTTNTGTMRDAIKKFSDAYNALNTYLVTQTKYDEENKIGGTLQGDSAAVGLRNQFRAMLRQDSAASAELTRLSDIGFNVQRDGSIVLDNAKLDAALAKPAELSKLFTTNDTANPATTGLGVRFQKLADMSTGTEGVIASRNAGLKARLERNQDDQDKVNDRADRMQVRLTQQYTALDTQMAKLTALSTYMTQQLAGLSNLYKKSDD
ncbi:flagellar hook protein [Methylibium sp. Pch-M]|uniref:flagellar filament capping protein FliD n=1 Tax=Methylibium sp. Pch-M TaxID=2082386 RepID=UPI0010139179|nr:flagellar filament capping protein FliD [Methylibium sp. Pch-M]QAZ40521.1 flagellar hook protein [Methylibium sp. Pch-M]